MLVQRQHRKVEEKPYFSVRNNYIFEHPHILFLLPPVLEK